MTLSEISILLKLYKLTMRLAFAEHAQEWVCMLSFTPPLMREEKFTSMSPDPILAFQQTFEQMKGSF